MAEVDLEICLPWASHNLPPFPLPPTNIGTVMGQHDVDGSKAVTSILCLVYEPLPRHPVFRQIHRPSTPGHIFDHLIAPSYLAYPKGAFLPVPPGRPLLTLCPPVSDVHVLAS
ncbi:hypothetical protein J6590_054076 [Homalodisca vitripennis]|nr:hypothetical protein J6590_054076 [Homalodisca vitripennis]